MAAAAPAIPAAAAIMICMRRVGPSRAIEVLLGRRPAKSKFLPNVYVPPGGRLDEADLSTKVHSQV